MQTRKNQTHGAIYALLAAVALWAPGLTQAAQRAPGPMGGTNMMDHCKQLMQERQKMLSELKQEDQKLQSMAAELNQGTEQQKVDRMVQIVQQMVKDRATAHQRMEAMHDRMMQHMAQHMHRGGMAQCPMMHQDQEMGGSSGGEEGQGSHPQQGSGSSEK